MAAMVLLVNGESFTLTGEQAEQMRTAIVDVMREGVGWLDVGDVSLLITPATQVSLRPSQATRVRL